MPEKVLESERMVEEANVQVEVEKEYRRPEELTPTAPFESEVLYKDPEKMLVPENVLLLARRVEEAAAIMISPVPLNNTPLMFLAV